MVNKEILEDLTKDCPCTKKGCVEEWCFFRDYLSEMPDKSLEQIRLIYDYKFMQSEKEGQDIGKKRATQEFINLYGKKFSDIYQEGMKNGELFEKVFGFKKHHTDEDIKEHIKNN